MSALLTFLEQSWLIVFFVSLIFLFFTIFRELNIFTRKMQKWSRISYRKSLPLISLSLEHYNRKGALLTNTSYNVCRSIRKDMLDLLLISRGYTNTELEKLVNNKDLLISLFMDEETALFFYDPGLWLKKFNLEPSKISLFLKPFRGIFKDKDDEEEIFYKELLEIIKNFSKIIDIS